MMRKKLCYTALATMVVLPSFLSPSAHAASEGNVTSKDEVVYATLTASGELDHIYVVNTLEVKSAGEILDYGKYTDVKNLTDLSDINQEGDSLQLDVPEGKFYYQGNMDEETELPWNVSVTYLLDGKKVDPAKLAGVNGDVQIDIDVAKNEKGETVFYDNYLLQVSLLLANTYENIDAPDGMIANAGKNKQITFTVMPGEEKRLTVGANVEDFEFQGVEIAAVPSTLPIDTSEMDSMTDDMGELSDAIAELNDGVADLEEGTAELTKGTVSMADGSKKYKSGINEIAGSSSGLTNGSVSIKDALNEITQSLASQNSETDLSSLTELPEGLTLIAKGLTETVKGVAQLQKNYSQAYQILDGAIIQIPANEITQEQIKALYESGADAKVIDSLVTSHEAAQKVKGTYAEVKEAFAAVEPGLTQVSQSVTEMANQLTELSKELSASLEETDMSGLSELQAGLSTLAKSYEDFHSGLVTYANGVGELSTSYNKIHSGIVELSGGTGELEDGVSELHDGTEELHEETQNLPEQMQEEINEMIKEYDKSDFEPVSFTSSKNEKTSSVQFVIKTESIEEDEKETKTAAPEKEKGFWELFLNLFK